MRNKDAGEWSRNRFRVSPCRFKTVDRIARETWLKIVTKEDISGGGRGFRALNLSSVTVRSVTARERATEIRNIGDALIRGMARIDASGNVVTETDRSEVVTGGHR